MCVFCFLLCYVLGTGRECNNILFHHYFPVSTSKEFAVSKLSLQAETSMDQITFFFKNMQLSWRNNNQTICKRCTEKRSSLYAKGQYQAQHSLFHFFINITDICNDGISKNS